MDKKKILVIDDEFPVRYLVEHQLKRKGFEVQAAKNGPTGLEAAREFQPDLIVLDVMMPEVDGYEVCQKIRNDPVLAETPVLFLSALMTKKHKLQAFEAGADDYLVKPFQPDELFAHISAILRRMEPKDVPTLVVEAPPPKEEKDSPEPIPSRILTFYSPKGGVGTTTLALQFSEALALREVGPVVLIDLNLPMGSVALTLKLQAQPHIVNLLNHFPEKINIDDIQKFTQRHRPNLFIIAAPDTVITDESIPDGDYLEPLLTRLIEAGYFVVLDLGSTLNDLTLTAMQLADFNYIVTSDEEVANKLTNAFLSAGDGLGLAATRLLLVVNELYGAVEVSEALLRSPLAYIPHANERSRTRLWVKEQSLQKLLSMALAPA